MRPSLEEKQIGNYIIDHRIARGATSEVWLAHHTYIHQRKAAIKLLLSHDDEIIERFHREANLVSVLHHPNIVQIFDFGYHEPFSYTILEYIHGSSLLKLLEQQGRLSISRATEIFKQIAQALDYAHRLNIVHRDVSPGNILIEHETGRALLADFGIARDINHSFTADYRIMGTPGYWSPEHLRSATEVTHLSDIYGLGVILYTMLTGVLPWDNIPGIPDHGFGPMIPFKQRGMHHLPTSIERVIHTMLAIDPAMRYPTAQDAVDELDHILKYHHATTLSYNKPSDTNQSNTSEVFQASGITQHAVETILGTELVRKHVMNAHQRAEELSQPAVIAHMLNEWSMQGFRQGLFRRALLGRLARLHRVHSYNIYFYTLQLLYEERGDWYHLEEPDVNPTPLPLEPELDRWQVTLPSVTIFQDDPGGQATIPGSIRIVKCQACNGQGKRTCPTCDGLRRILVERTVSPDDLLAQTDSFADKKRKTSLHIAPDHPSTSRHFSNTNANISSRKAHPPPERETEVVLTPCPDCDGRGGTECPDCAGTGRMLQSKVFNWRRITSTLEVHDDIPTIVEPWLLKHCSSEEIYRERIVGNPQSDQPPFRAEWLTIPRLNELLKQANQGDTKNRRVILSELSVRMIPMTEVLFDLGKPDDLFTISICGFEKSIPTDWRLLNWERVIFFWISLFLLVLVIIFAFFLL